MQTIRDLSLLRNFRASLEGTVALVPTMGALHDGHIALVAAARTRADHVIASIFVNPMQFGPAEDLAVYPRREATDAAMLKEAGVAALWAPDVVTMYPEGFATKVVVDRLGEGQCGATRPGHFEGVATVVTKLFGQVRPDLALFGEKDWQQLAIIRRVAADLDIDIEIGAVPTQRDIDGLALSSRNVYLAEDERLAARMLPRALGEAAAAIEAGGDVDAAIERATIALTRVGFAVDYVELVDANLLPLTTLEGEARLMAAARIGKTRLIDNLPVSRH